MIAELRFEKRCNSSLEHALRYAAAGLSVVAIECDGTKQPPRGRGWKHLQREIASPEELWQMFRGNKGIAIISGKVSGNLETLDVDAPELVEPFETAVRRLAPGLLERLPTVATPRNNWVGSSRVDLQACKLEYSIVSPK